MAKEYAVWDGKYLIGGPFDTRADADEGKRLAYPPGLEWPRVPELFVVSRVDRNTAWSFDRGSEIDA